MLHRHLSMAGILLVSMTVLTACGTEKNPEKKENVLMEQFNTMDKARSVEDTLKDAQQQRRESEEEQTSQ